MFLIASTAKQLLLAANRMLPHAKNYVHFAVRKYIVRKIFSTADEFDKLPERRWIRERLLPAVAASRPKRVVFVGSAPYTHHYENEFIGTPSEFITVDSQPASRVWGAKYHIVDAAENIGNHLPPGSVDVFIMIGVYGFGTDTKEHFGAVLCGAHSVLKRNGSLIVSWNNDIVADPSDGPELAKLFTHAGVWGLPARKQFNGRNLVIDCYLAKHDDAYAE
jgi:hypothetical protein